MLRAFHNVCTHQAAPVTIGSGQCNCLICPYYAWTFNLALRRGAIRSL
ncbi:MAG: Rieske 2Fe-2S domain-containing protein [Leptolyngbyaceae cyanobacterium CRU_2_3]|nr:Rieske 2Fe-2S domain-containing protein [Leptolyngbyaceae cyanobacterium CRU_2_3]